MSSAILNVYNEAKVSLKVDVANNPISRHDEFVEHWISQQTSVSIDTWNYGLYALAKVSVALLGVKGGARGIELLEKSLITSSGLYRRDAIRVELLSILSKFNIRLIKSFP